MKRNNPFIDFIAVLIALAWLVFTIYGVVSFSLAWDHHNVEDMVGWGFVVLFLVGGAAANK